MASDKEWADETRNSLRFAKEMGRVENVVVAKAATSVEAERGALEAELKAARQLLRGAVPRGLEMSNVDREQLLHNLEELEKSPAALAERSGEGGEGMLVAYFGARDFLTQTPARVFGLPLYTSSKTQNVPSKST